MTDLTLRMSLTALIRYKFWVEDVMENILSEHVLKIWEDEIKKINEARKDIENALFEEDE